VEAASAASSGGDGGEAAEQLPALRLEARDAVLALLGRMRQLAAFRTAHLKAAKHLAAMGDDGAPRHTPLLAQLAGAAAPRLPLCLALPPAALHRLPRILCFSHQAPLAW
jgi:hypothetical protein